MIAHLLSVDKQLVLSQSTDVHPSSLYLAFHSAGLAEHRDAVVFQRLPFGTVGFKQMNVRKQNGGVSFQRNPLCMGKVVGLCFLYLPFPYASNTMSDVYPQIAERLVDAVNVG